MRDGGALLAHRRDGRLDDAVEGAAPAGMGGADHPGLGIGEQHRRAIGGEDAQRHAGRAGHHGVDLRGFLPRPGLLDQSDADAVGLIGGDDSRGIDAGSARRRGVRFSATRAGSSPEPKPQLSEA